MDRAIRAANEITTGQKTINGLREEFGLDRVEDGHCDCLMVGIDQEKLEWMDEVGIKPFDRPMLFYFGNGVDCVYSGEYIESTSLEELKERHKKMIGDLDSKEE